MRVTTRATAPKAKNPGLAATFARQAGGAVFDIIGAVLCVIGVIAMANLVGLA